jgi:hypothetical protein
VLLKSADEVPQRGLILRQALRGQLRAQGIHRDRVVLAIADIQAHEDCNLADVHHVHSALRCGYEMLARSER